MLFIATHVQASVICVMRDGRSDPVTWTPLASWMASGSRTESNHGSPCHSHLATHILPLTSCHSHLALPRMQAFPSFKEGLYRNACVKRVKAGNPGALGSASVDSSVSSVVHKQLPVSESFEANSPSGVGGGHGAIATVASVKAVLEGVESMKLDSRGDGSAKERSRKGVLDDPTSHSGKEFSSSSSPASPLELPMIRA